MGEVSACVVFAGELVAAADADVAVGTSTLCGASSTGRGGVGALRDWAIDAAGATARSACPP